MEDSQKNQYGRPRLDGRQIDELIGIARGVLADGYLDDREVQFMRDWLSSNLHITKNALVSKLYDRIKETLADDVIDQDERIDLIETLEKFCRNDFSIGEALKASTLPLCEPAPTIEFESKRFCLTGTFVFGSRSTCKEAISERGGIVCPITKKTDYVVIGEYATDSWKHSSFGNKILKAMSYRDEKAVPLSIVSETHWRSFL